MTYRETVIYTVVGFDSKCVHLVKWCCFKCVGAVVWYLLFTCVHCAGRLDGKHVVFGKVVEGIELVKKIEGYGTQSGTPSTKVTIEDCGQL